MLEEMPNRSKSAILFASGNHHLSTSERPNYCSYDPFVIKLHYNFIMPVRRIRRPLVSDMPHDGQRCGIHGDATNIPVMRTLSTTTEENRKKKVKPTSIATSNGMTIHKDGQIDLLLTELQRFIIIDIVGISEIHWNCNTDETFKCGWVYEQSLRNGICVALIMSAEFEK